MYSVLPVRSHRRLANNVWLKLHEKERSTFQLAFVVVAVDPQINLYIYIYTNDVCLLVLRLNTFLTIMF